jgi:hypothetical protein
MQKLDDLDAKHFQAPEVTIDFSLGIELMRVNGEEALH